jgi:hypothetical protein
MSGRSDEYRSYLLRIWRSGRSASSGWRASLEDIHTGQRHSFASLDAAFTFLDLQTEPRADDQEGGQNPPHASMTERSS